jgi:hypothetical protein
MRIFSRRPQRAAASGLAMPIQLTHIIHKGLDRTYSLGRAISFYRFVLPKTPLRQRPTTWACCCSKCRGCFPRAPYGVLVPLPHECVSSVVFEGRQRQAVVRWGQGVACCGWMRFRLLYVAGFDFGKMVFDVTKKADGATGAAVGPPLAIGMQGAIV